MHNVNVVVRDGVAVITMVRGRANALQAAMVRELREALERAGADERVRAIVLASGNPALFSAGFDVREVFEYDDGTMRAFVGDFFGLIADLRMAAKPVVAAVSGHARAGGAILALACDFRVVGEGTFGLAVNEVDLGIVLPTSLLAPISRRLGAAARRVLMAGDVLSPDDLRRCGAADEVVALAEVPARAFARALQLAGKPPHALAAHKAALDALEGGVDRSNLETAIGEFMESWCGRESREARGRLAASMRAGG